VSVSVTTPHPALTPSPSRLCVHRSSRYDFGAHEAAVRYQLPMPTRMHRGCVWFLASPV
jgi:hypothetical protein